MEGSAKGGVVGDGRSGAIERGLEVPRATLLVREVGAGAPAIVLHGGPDFDHRYLLPDLDRLADLFRLVCYDQRGRGGSAAGVQPEDVSMAGELDDLEAVRQHTGAQAVTLVGHSWGAVLALAYARCHPERVSRLVLLNPAPASADDFDLMLRARREAVPDDVARLRAIASTKSWRRGDPDAMVAYYRVHFRRALARPEDLERVIAALRPCFVPEAVVKARAIEERLFAETWAAPGWSLLSGLGALRIPALVVAGEHDFIPATCAAHIAEALADARLATLKGCGHFACLEAPEALRRELLAFLRAPTAGQAP